MDNQEADDQESNDQERDDQETDNHEKDDQESENQDTKTLEHDGSESMEKIWPQLRTLLVFQIKLYIDAFRDLFLSALSLGAFIIDLVQQNTGENTYFNRVLKFGRKTEVTINLFNQYNRDEQSGTSVDSILQEVEDRIKEQAERARERDDSSEKPEDS
ncbi:MAG: hypothetical protein HOF74_05265 [Gammaproteobacteria bacterium]|nr:hypothetical protein [Gammaproteobacteria bacterium]MBT3859219.1 hypothetical protein [Gammaproteobacteria bacterium]MBT3988087.1 hypothetical protein [Gammaproteobacteria bacterium]MBT4254551.1 hypothetical protein [Gammaproteobacteria bacterium]MBT4583018.1 hypothetical protein [Gammaproteobacteria bacterium]